MESDTTIDSPMCLLDAADIPWYVPEPTVSDHLADPSTDEREWLDVTVSVVAACTPDEVAALLIDTIIERERYRAALHAAMESIRFAENARTWAMRSAGRL